MKQFMILTIFLAIAQPAWSAVTDMKLKGCDPQEILGTWESIDISVNPKYAGTQNASTYPYQRYYFDAQGRTKLMTSNEPFDDIAEITWAKMPPKCSYTMNSDSAILTKCEGNPLQNDVCVHMSGMQPADIALVTIAPNGEPYSRKVLRKKSS